MNWEAGKALSPVSKPSITREQLKEYARAAKDFNPIHLDEDFAKEAGFPSVIVHGMLSMGFLGDLLLQNFPAGKYRILRFKGRFRKVTFPGDSITCTGEVKKVAPDGHIVVSFRASNQTDEVKTDGEATLQPL